MLVVCNLTKNVERTKVMKLHSWLNPEPSRGL
jgi:hypothetical protein